MCIKKDMQVKANVYQEQQSMPEQQQEQMNQQQLVNQGLGNQQTEKGQQSEDITEGWEEIKELDLIIEAGIDTWDNPIEEKKNLEKGQEAVIEKNKRTKQN